MTLDMKDLETAMKAAETAAIAKDWYGQWFDSIEEYEEWAGDVFQFLFEKACEAIDIFFEEEETYIPDDIDESNYNPYIGCDEYDDYDHCEYCEAGVCNGCCNDIPDDVDETNYEPYCGNNMFEICGSIDEEW